MLRHRFHRVLDRVYPILVTIAVAAAVARTQRADAQADLIFYGPSASPIIQNTTILPTDCAAVEGCTTAGPHSLLRFNAETRNIGNADMVLGNPVGNPLFVFAACHSHYHFKGYAAYRLVDPHGQITRGVKAGFCVEDFPNPWDPGANPLPFYTCNNQGIQRGWRDTYATFTDCQWVDITGLPPGQYTLEMEINPNRYLVESNYCNNVTFVPVTIPGTGDNCASAIVIADGTYTGTTAGRNNDGSNTCGVSSATPDVWYAYAAPFDGTLVVDTCGSAYDTVLSVHSGCPGTNINELACNDDCLAGACVGSRQSCLQIPVTANTNYKIRVSGFSGATGNYTLNVATAPSLPSNNNCASAIAIGEGVFNGSTSLASNDGSASCGNSTTSPDVWYAFTATCTGNLLLDTCSSGFDTVLSVHTGCPGTTANEIACNDDCLSPGRCCGTTRSCLTVPVTAGTTYRIRVAGFNGASGPFRLGVAMAAPVNDDCGRALVIGDGTYTGTTCASSTDGSASCDSAGSPDVWYSYTAGCNGTLHLDTCGSAYDTILSIHSGCPGTTSNELACNDDCISLPCGLRDSCLQVPVSIGTTYWIRVSGFDGHTGDYVLHVANVAGLANDNCAAATAITDGTYFGTTCGATNDGSATCGTSATTPEVWYAYTAACTGTLSIDTCASGYDTVLSVHSGCPGTSINQLACSDDCLGAPCGGLNSCVTLLVTASTTYRIRVSGFNGATGSFRLHVALAPPVNDNCAAATPVGNGVFAFNTCNATTDGPNEPAACNFFGYTQVDSDIWYRYTAPCNGTAGVSLCGSSYDTKLAIYGAACPAGPASIICNDDACGLQSQVLFPVVAGGQYLIRIGGFNGAQGSGVMAISCCAGPPDGDMNLDGVADGDDIQRFEAALNAGSINPIDLCHGDFNGNGVIDPGDVPGMVTKLLS